MYNNKECADYFKSRSEYKRCFREFKKKWKSLGKAGGVITLEKTSSEERQAIGGIIGRVFYEENIKFSFSEFELGLQKTRFAPVNIKAVLEEYFGETLITTGESRKEEKEKKEKFLNEIILYFKENFGKNSTAFMWISESVSERKYGYRIIIKEYARNEMQTELLVKNVGKALMKLSEMREIEEEYPLAVFAAEITDNPHYFDRGTTPGLLFLHSICFIEKEELPENAHQWRRLLMQVLIAPDNISSMLHAFGLRLLTKEGRHPAYDAFCNLRETCVITMENMKGIIGAETFKKVFAVENEMVFSYLIHNLKDFNYTLLCTSGQPHAVAQVLITYILNSGAEIYYNGDMDPDGVRIADRLWQKFGDNIHIWRMTHEDYRKSISKEKIGEIGRVKLENISHPVLKETAQCIKECGLAGYQENILKDLLFDIKKLCLD